MDLLLSSDRRQSNAFLSAASSAYDSDLSLDDLSEDEGVSQRFLRGEDVQKGGYDLVGADGSEATTCFTAQEYRLSFLESLKLYPTALGWSIFFSVGIVMTAFDQQLLGLLFATPAFQREFGYEYRPGNFIIQAAWQTALTMCGPCGQTIGT